MQARGLPPSRRDLLALPHLCFCLEKLSGDVASEKQGPATSRRGASQDAVLGLSPGAGSCSQGLQRIPWKLLSLEAEGKKTSPLSHASRSLSSSFFCRPVRCSGDMAQGAWAVFTPGRCSCLPRDGPSVWAALSDPRINQRGIQGTKMFNY